MENYDGEDKYTASIELSNKCREFYHRRLESAEAMKKRMAPATTATRGGQKSPIGIAMQKLASEMSSLMDQDLSLMKQLLMLNESIEELKWKRRHSYESMAGSSCELSGSDWSVSDTDMFASESELTNDKANTKSEETLLQNFRHSCSLIDKHSTPKLSRKSLVTNVIYKHTAEENQNSCDSGIHDESFDDLDT